ncbi:iron-sulfur cluster repair protein YtfE [Marinobacter sp. W-8]|uniref:iron-sulfur cluster repair protein YtfE n=1 Tax=Marinobacter sp. W-8 TaxID=3369658 RepID=UPI0037C76180
MNLTEQPIGQLARDIPGASAVLHRHKLDFCCGGNTSLADAAIAKGLDPDTLASQLDSLRIRMEKNIPAEKIGNEDLIEHILTRYHDVHRDQLPELIRLAQRVERVHSQHPRCPSGLSAHLESMQAELEAHMQKEEQILFPMIARGITGMAVGPVSVMRSEHDDHGNALARIHNLTFKLTLPEGACNTWRALYSGLTELENDLKQHIHLENNVLFHRVDGQLGGARHG